MSEQLEQAPVEDLSPEDYPPDEDDDWDNLDPNDLQLDDEWDDDFCSSAVS